MTSKKLDFILDLISNHKLTTSDKERLLTLSARELQKLESVDPVLEKRIQRIEKKIGIPIDRSEYTLEIKPEDKKDEYITKIQKLKEEFAEIKYNQLHNPEGFTRLLKLFKIDNESGFKELIHTPIEKGYDFYNHCNNLISFIGEKIILKCKSNSLSPEYAITRQLFDRIIELFKNFYIYGKVTWEKNESHPCSYEKLLSNEIKGSEEYLKRAKDFKRSIRYDKKSIQYNAMELYHILFLTTRDGYDEKFGKNRILRTPLSETLFKEITVFFTDTISINTFVKKLFEDTLLNNTNIKGNTAFDPKAKQILIDFKRKKLENGSGYTYSLIICDKDSYATETPENIYKGLKDYWTILNTVCDWTIECYTTCGDNKTYRINMLNKQYMETRKRYEEISGTPNEGFTHILTFYDIE